LFLAQNSGTAAGSYNTQIQYFRGPTSGTPVVTKTIDYGAVGSCPATVGFAGIVPVPIRETLALPSGLSRKTEYCYDGYAHVTATKEWNYQPGGNFGSTPDRETDAAYVTGASYINANILRLPQTVTVVSNGSQFAR